MKYIFWITLFFTLFLRGIVFLDPDFGWRLRSGEIILQSGVPWTDPFTYSMPSYPWINHAWGTDVIIAFLYPLVGNVGLSLIFSILTVASIYITYSLTLKLKKSNIKSFWYLSAPLLMITAASFFRFSGVRAQVWTWVFMSLIFKLILVRDLWLRWRLMLPVIFLFWVNLHGGFAAGLVTLFFVFIFRAFKEKKIDIVDCIVLLASVFITFVNPYGTQIYKEVWNTLSDHENHKNILEWNNYFKSFNLPSLFLITLSTIFIYGSFKKIKFDVLSLYTFFLYQALTAVRQVPIFAMIAFFASMTVLRDFYSTLKDKASKLRFKEVYRIFYAVTIFVFAIEILLAFFGSYYYSEKVFYPKDALFFIKQNIPDGEIFSKYDYGGYLIWKLPEKKVFIDGRMPFWKRQESPSNESRNAMSQYMSLLRGSENYKSFFSKHNIELVLWSSYPKRGELEEIENKLSGKLQFLYKLIGVERQNFSLIKDIEGDGWVKIYEDNVAVVYKKP